MKGPRPMPSALRLLRGDMPQNSDEPCPEVAIPTCPQHLDEAARTEWERISAELAALGVLTRIDRAALAGYCQAWSRWERAERLVHDMGEVVKSPNGFPVANPYLAIANKALKQIKEFAVEFGLTPSSRTRVKAKPPALPQLTKEQA